MKKIIIILLLSLIGCNKDKEIIQIKKEKPLIKEEMASGNADVKLLFSNEKIALIALKNKIPSDSVYLILYNYFDKTPYFPNLEINSYEKIIDTISKDLNTPKEKVATLIFEFEQGNQDIPE